MSCERIRAQLTPYLDGELDGDRGTVVRGHLRTCTACAHVAEQEAALRDGLRALPSIDPPSTLWAGVQARLAQEEVAESQRPAWRRAFARWRRLIPAAPRLAAGGLVVAAAIAIVYVKTRPAEEPAQLVLNEHPMPVFVPSHPEPPRPNPQDCLEAAPAADVTDDLAAEPGRITACYVQAADALIAESKPTRAAWSDDRKAAFDTKVQSMRAAIAKAPEGKPRQRASQALLRYLDGAVIREDVLLASRGDR